MKKKLGRGLDALIPEGIDLANFEEKLGQAGKLETLAIERVSPNPDQPRKHFAPQAMKDLTESVRLHGVLQPLFVRKKGADYIIIAGERRYRAAKEAGLTEVPAIVLDVDDATASEISLIENIQREDLSPAEEAQSYQTLMKTFSWTQEELAKKIGKSRSYVANTLRLLKLDPLFLDALTENLITANQARSLLMVPPENRNHVMEKLLLGNISIRDIEKRTRRKKKKDIYLTELEEKLTESLGRNVTINERKEGGSIVIDYYNEEDLETLLAEIGGYDA